MCMWREEVALLVGGKDLSQAHHVVLVAQDKPEANHATKRAERHAPDEAGCGEEKRSCKRDGTIVQMRRLHYIQVAQMEIAGVDR